MWFALAAILMLFMGLTSAYVMRRGLDPAWQPIRIPGIALINTAILLASSATLELGRRSATRVLGLAFAAGQLMLWRQLAAAGFYLSTNAHASFVYVLTALHGLHLLGGIAALQWASGTRTPVAALYWHFLTGLWVYLMVVLFAWR
jgi:cytochrome c oxidase subunit 3